MNRFTLPQRLEIIQLFYQNSRSFVATQRSYRAKHGRHSAPTEQAIRRIVTKLESEFTLLDKKPLSLKDKMAEETPVVAEVPASSSPKKVKKAATGPKMPKAKPPTGSMVNAAIAALKERGGSSLPAIKKYLAANYKVDVEKLAPSFKKYLKGAVVGGKLIQTKGKGASGSFKLPAKEKVEKKMAAAKPKPAKKSGEKKAAAKPKKAGEKKAAKPKKATGEKPAKKKAAAATAKAAKKTGSVKSKTPKIKAKAPKPKKATGAKKPAAKKASAKK